MSEITETRELSNKINAATSVEQIRAALMAEAQKQGVVAIQDGGYVIAPETAKHTRVATINGQEMVFTGNTELEVEQQMGLALKAALSDQTSGATTQPPAQDPNFAKAELELKFKRGEISTQAYLEQSGAVAEYLESRGKTVEQSWSEATDVFLNSAAGADWPGGNENLQAIAAKLMALGLTDATDKVAAFETAWNAMKKENQFVPYVTAATETTHPSDVASPEEIMDAWKKGIAAQGRDLGEAFNTQFTRPKDRTSSTIFGR